MTTDKVLRPTITQNLRNGLIPFISSAISYWRRLLASGFRKLRFAEPIIAETGVLFFEKQYNLPWYLNAFTIRISPMP